MPNLVPNLALNLAFAKFGIRNGIGLEDILFSQMLNFSIGTSFYIPDVKPPSNFYLHFYFLDFGKLISSNWRPNFNLSKYL